MKHLFPVLISIAGAGAFLLGWSAGEPTSVAANEATANVTHSSPASADAERPKIEPLATKQLGGVTPEQARSRAFQILSIPDRIERMRQFSELLFALTPENWTSIVDAFVVQRRSEGRTFREESSLMLDRIGEVCGIA